MRLLIRRAIQVTLMSGGLLLAGAATASAEEGVLSGNQVIAPVQAPTVVCGNAVAVVGETSADCTGPASTGGTTATNTTSGGSGDDGLASGNQVAAPVSAPVVACGNAVAVVGDASADCEGSASSGGTTATNTDGGSSKDDDGTASGNQVVAPVSAPVVVCGNAVGVVGKASASCEGTATSGGTTARNTDSGSKGDDGAVSGNQVVAPVSAPTVVCGNAVAVVGGAKAHCEGTATSLGTTATNTDGKSGGDDGALSGNQVVAPVQAPTAVCGNAVAVVGGAKAHCEGTSTARSVHASNWTGGSQGDGGVASGNQVVAPAQVPTVVCGNAVAVVGGAKAHCEGTSTARSVHARNSSGGSNDGGGIASDNQVVAPISAPIVACGNAAAVVGGAKAHCSGSATSLWTTASNTGASSKGDDGILSGNQVVAPVQVPTVVCGNAVAVVGGAKAHCSGTSTSGSTHASNWAGSKGDDGILSGNQVVAPVSAPIVVCGNAAAVVGGAQAHCSGIATSGGTTATNGGSNGGGSGASSGGSSSGTSGGTSGGNASSSSASTSTFAVLSSRTSASQASSPATAGSSRSATPNAAASGVLASKAARAAAAANGGMGTSFGAVPQAVTAMAALAVKGVQTLARAGAAVLAWVVLVALCLMAIGAATRGAVSPVRQAG